MKNPSANHKTLILSILIIGGIGVQTSCVGDIDFPPALPTDFGYCVFAESKTCSSGSTKVCPAGGRLNNECPYGSSSSSDNSSSSSSDGSSSSGIGLKCDGFIDGTEREHYGKSKPQFCDERDGQKYVYVTIGTQTWMAQNLNYQILSLSICTDNCDEYGQLYDWSTAMALPSDCNSNSCSGQVEPPHKGICPEGWHIPSEAEWDILIAEVGGSFPAGAKLKATSGWNIEYTDDYGFSALPSAISVSHQRACWLISTSEGGPYTAYAMSMSTSSNVFTDCYDKRNFHYSVRCLKD